MSQVEIRALDQIVANPGLFTLQAVAGITVVVPDNQDADRVALNAVKEVIRETIQVGAPQIATDGMESDRVFENQCNKNHELVEEGITQFRAAGFVVEI